MNTERPEPPQPPAEEIARATKKAQRNSLLAASDWTQLPDSPLSEGMKKEWAVYRQELRDFDYNDMESSLPRSPLQADRQQNVGTPVVTPVPANLTS